MLAARDRHKIKDLRFLQKIDGRGAFPQVVAVTLCKLAVIGQRGDEVRLKKGAEVEITVEADPEATTPTSKGTP